MGGGADVIIGEKKRIGSYVGWRSVGRRGGFCDCGWVVRYNVVRKVRGKESLQVGRGGAIALWYERTSPQMSPHTFWRLLAVYVCVCGCLHCTYIQ